MTTTVKTISASAVLHEFARSRSVFLIIFGSTILLGFLYFLLWPSTYTATLDVTASSATQEAQTKTGMGALLSGGAASLLGGQGDTTNPATPLDQFMEVSKSDELANILDKKYHLTRLAFFGRWDAQRGVWLEHGPGLLNAVLYGIKSALGLDPGRIPDAHDLAQYIGRHMDVKEIERTSIWEYTFEDRSPAIAEEFLRLIDREGDALVRKQAVERNSEYISYAEQRLTEVKESDYRDALLQLIIEQENERMILSAKLPYAADHVLQPISPDHRTSPLFTRTMVIATVLGFVFGCFGVYLRSLGYLQNFDRWRRFGQFRVFGIFRKIRPI